MRIDHIAMYVNNLEKENVDRITEKIKNDGYEVISGPRTTGDDYYESCILDPEGNQIEITADTYLESMIREVRHEDIPMCVEVITESFMTVADEYGFTEENAPGFTAFATTTDRLYEHMDGEHRLQSIAKN